MSGPASAVNIQINSLAEKARSIVGFSWCRLSGGGRKPELSQCFWDILARPERPGDLIICLRTLQSGVRSMVALSRPSRHAQRFGSSRYRIRKRGCRSNIRHRRRRESRFRRNAPHVKDRARSNQLRAGGGVHGGNPIMSHWPLGHLPADLGVRRLEPYDRGGLRAFGRLMLMITGQKAIKGARQALFQSVDIAAAMRPLTKRRRQVFSAASIPASFAMLFRKNAPDRCTLELPQDIAAEEAAAPLVPPHAIERPIRPPSALSPSF
ncbi:MAG: acetolactate synthase [Rhodospirillales bacterium]|nr:acetolactate synthase [Rhodospirillales bacterium]